MKVGTDAMLLGAWATAPATEPADILDIGTGTGIVALMMAQRFPLARVTAIEIDSEAAGQARENVAASPFADRVEVRNVALQQFHGGPFRAIVCNPPFFTNALTCPDPRRTTSRHAATLSYADLAQSAARLLLPSGILTVVLPTQCRSQMEAEAALAGLCASRTCLVATKPGAAPKRVLLSWVKGIATSPVETVTITLGDPIHQSMLQPFLKRKGEDAP